MTNVRSRRKLGANAKQNQQKQKSLGTTSHINTAAPHLNKENVTQKEAERKGSLPKKLNQDFQSTKSRILGALNKLDDFLLNPQVR